MSGHSKWANIKHRKAKGDAVRGKIFTKIGREIAVAVKAGGADPEINAKLKDIISKAKAVNMPNDNISRSIKKASGELNSINYEEIVYEGYGSGGVAVIVETLTDNKNRTAGDVRYFFDKFGGSLGTNGSVSYMFDKKGLIVILKDCGLSEDDIFSIALEAGADDVIAEEEGYEIYTMPQDFGAVCDALQKAGLSFVSAQIEMVPQNYITIEGEQLDKFLKMIEKMEDSDDIQNIYHNADYVEDDAEE